MKFSLSTGGFLSLAFALLTASAHGQATGSGLSQACGLPTGCTATIVAMPTPGPTQATYVTPAATYGAGLGALSQVRSIIAAGAPTIAYVELPAATANVNKTRVLYNLAGGAVNMVPASGVVNVSAALTPYICPANKVCTCHGITTGIWGCGNQ